MKMTTRSKRVTIHVVFCVCVLNLKIEQRFIDLTLKSQEFNTNKIIKT
jgi:hypothetical protein